MKKPKEPEIRIVEEAPSWIGKLLGKKLKVKKLKTRYLHHLQISFHDRKSRFFYRTEDSSEQPKEFGKFWNWWWNQKSQFYKLRYDKGGIIIDRETVEGVEIWMDPPVEELIEEE